MTDDRLSSLRQGGADAIQRPLSHWLPGLLCEAGHFSPPEQGAARKDVASIIKRAELTAYRRNSGARAPDIDETEMSFDEIKHGVNHGVFE